MKWIYKIIETVLANKSEGEVANPMSVKIARYTTIAACVGAFATIFPIVWSTPPWWITQKQQVRMVETARRNEALEKRAVEAVRKAAPEMQVSAAAPEKPSALPWFSWIFLGIAILSIVSELFARRRFKQTRPPFAPPAVT